MIRLYLLLFIIATLSGIGYTGYSYYTKSQATIAQLRENNVLLEQAVEENQATIDRMVAEAARNAELQQELQARLQEATQVMSSLRTRLSQIDITREALADPTDMEARINRGVERLIERIYEETGGEVVNTSDDDNTPE